MAVPATDFLTGRTSTGTDRLRARISHWLLHRLGLRPVFTDVTSAERDCLARHCCGKRRIVEIGVFHGATTGLLRSVMDANGTIVGIDPFPRGRLRFSIERSIAHHEIARYPRGQVSLLRERSSDAAVNWCDPIDFLFIDGDHSWSGIASDWRDWTTHVVPDGIVAIHDSKSVPWCDDFDTVRYTREVISRDDRFEEVDAVDSLTILRRSSLEPKSMC